MTSQISDEVRFHGVWYAITAVDGAGLFDPTEHGLKPGPLSTACWRGFICRYHIEQGQLTLEDVEMGRPTSDHTAIPLFGVPAGPADDRSEHAGALRYERLAAPMPFTRRLLLGADYVHMGYLNMGFQPAWLYRTVYEVAFDAGRLTAAHDRSTALAEVRLHLGVDGLRPAPGEPTRAWIDRTFSLTFGYSWPSVG